MRKRGGWVAGVGVMAVFVGVLHADSRDDLSRVKAEYDAVMSHYATARTSVDQYITGSVNLRALDQNELNTLIGQVCRLDIARDGDDPDQRAQQMKAEVVGRVRNGYDQVVDAGSHVFDDLGRLESEAKSARSHAHDLESKDDVKSDAEQLGRDIEKAQDEISKLFDRINDDRRTLDRVRDGAMNGSNNPRIRAAMEYGKQKHQELQRDKGCDEKEVVLSSGRPDCIKFDQDDCKVIEFKPSTYSESDAASQAERYLGDVISKFKDDDRAKRCKQDSGKPVFRAVGVLYPACQP